MDTCIKKILYVYTTEYYSATKKKNEILLLEATWMSLKESIISKISQALKEKN